MSLNAYFTYSSCSAKAFRGRPRWGRIYFRLAFSSPHAHGRPRNNRQRVPDCLKYTLRQALDCSWRRGPANAKLWFRSRRLCGLGNFSDMKCRFAVSTDSHGRVVCAAWVAGFCLEYRRDDCRHAAGESMPSQSFPLPHPAGTW